MENKIQTQRNLLLIHADLIRRAQPYLHLPFFFTDLVRCITTRGKACLR